MTMNREKIPNIKLNKVVKNKKIYKKIRRFGGTNLSLQFDPCLFLCYQIHNLKKQ